MRIFKIAQTTEQMEFPFAIETEEELPAGQVSEEPEELPIENGYVDKDELREFIQKYRLPFETFSDLLKVQHNGQDYWFEDDFDDYKLIDNMQQWIYDVRESEALEILQLQEEDIHMNGVDSTLKDLRDNPGTVFHWTTEEKWEDIQASGELRGSYGTGINNRSAHGIFTSVDAEEYEMGSYGNVCLEIDLGAFHKDYGGSLNLDCEPEVLEAAIREALAYKLGVEGVFEASIDISPMTVIVGHAIPLKYIRKIN